MPEWTEIILIVAMAVIVPLGMALVDRDRPGDDQRTPHLDQLGRLHPIAAAIAAVSFAFDPGAVAGVLTIPWLAFTFAVAAVGIGRVLGRPTIATNAIGVDAGLAFLAVGGAWLTLSRLGLRPMGFDDVIVRLTAVHFHYAGFALPIVASLVAPDDHGRPGLLPGATIVAVPLTATGIIVGGTTEWITATTMAAVGMAVAVRLVVVGRRQTGPARGLLITAGLALTTGMCLAIAFAWFVFFRIDGLTIDRMARTHGSLNAFGFGLLALIGLRLIQPLTIEAATGTTTPTGTTLALRHATSGVPDHLVATADQPTTVAAIQTRRGTRTDTWTDPIPLDRFDEAVIRLRTWAGHERAGIERLPHQPTIAEGATIAMTIPVGPLAVTATCRIVDVVDEPDRFAFTYATLPHHVVEGVETFTVGRNEHHAWVEVTAVWRPLALAARLAPPVTRYLQGRAIARFLKGIAGDGPAADGFDANPELEVAP